MPYLLHLTEDSKIEGRGSDEESGWGRDSGATIANSRHGRSIVICGIFEAYTRASALMYNVFHS